MTLRLGNQRTDAYRIATNTPTPVVISKRVTCELCRRSQSLGQYPIGRNICITCKPMPKGWRRGDLA